MKKFLTLFLTVCLTAGIPAISACTKDTANTSEYVISAVYDSETSTLTGCMDFTYYNDTDNEISDLKFNLYGNAYREGATYSPVSHSYQNTAYYDGVSYGSMTVNGVENCSSWNVGGDDENILTVTLLTPVYPEENAEITINYTLVLANINHRTGVTEKTVNLGNFYPVLCSYSAQGFTECNYYYCGDPFLSDCANYSVILELPAQYDAASSGKLEKSSESSGIKHLEYSLENARDFALVLSENFTVLSEDIGGVKVSYYYTDDEQADANFKAVKDSFTYFSETFGNYVYPTLSVVQTGFCYGGMEYPALTMINSSLTGDDCVYTIVHENAHQWWYAMVGSNQLENPWQDEGLAEYSSVMFFENHPEYNFTRAGIVGSATKAYRAYYSVYKQLFGETDTTMNRHLKDYESEYEYSNIAYNKGLLMFELLRQSIGDAKFEAGLKKYFAENLYKTATCDDLIGSFISSGLDLEGFFNSFIEGKIII